MKQKRQWIEKKMNPNKKALYGNKFVNLKKGKLKLGDFDALRLIKSLETPTFVF